MEDVNMHICPTCGGKLLVDTERQMYECPYCGVTFDYDYFREESVLGIAAQSLMNKEFTSADRAYDFLLEKEPDNFEALRGKALVAMNIPKIDDISSLDLYSKIDYKSACKEIDRAIGSSKPQDHEYFTVMKDIVDAGNEYIEDKARLEKQRSERTRTLYDLNDYVKERDTICIYSSARIRPKKAVILTVVCYIFCCLLVFLGYKAANRNPYSKAEDLSKYETIQTEAKNGWIYSSDNDLNNISGWYTNNKKLEEALEREEQRKINYDEWEKNHSQYATKNLIGILCIFTVIFAVIVFVLFIYGRRIDAVISRIWAKADEQADKIKNCEERMAAAKERIDQGYKRLCELHPVNG
ncbi:MAG: hypothetical protein IKF09_02830 [Clostridiales bacterium]|nr:hypothetical protein [Clostridiales bacterium]